MPVNNLKKMGKQHRKEREKQFLLKQEEEKVLENILHFSKKRFKKFDEVILQLYNNEDLSAHFADRRIWKVNDCFSKFSSKSKLNDREILKDTLIHLNKYSSLILSEDFIRVVFNMVLYRAYWMKDIFDWKPLSKNSSRQMNELAFYLFCQYSVPEFMYKAFYEKEDMLYIIWFMHIGTGKKIKDLTRMPIPFTQKMGHFFLQAPSKFNIQEALRWAQVRGLGGDNRVAERFAYSWLGNKHYDDEVFWEAFIRLVVNGGMFNHDKLTDLIDYVRESKTENMDYSLKGRTLQSLTRQSDEWHKKEILVRGAQIWNSCGIDGFKIEKKEEAIALEELLRSKLLVNEGRAMKHCVGSYISYCKTGRSAIFSMRKYSFGVLKETMATIEVNVVSKRVVQAKAKSNAKISVESKKHLEIWARNMGLILSPYL